jgi:hypothetical protein
MMNMWERLSAAIETNPSDVGYFVNSLVTTTAIAHRKGAEAAEEDDLV